MAETTGKRGRPSAEDIRAEVDTQTRHEVEVYGKRELRLDEVDARFGGVDFGYSADRIEGEIRVMLKTVELAYMEIGRRLILLKEHEGHGNYLKRLESLGIPRRNAANIMKATVVAQQLGAFSGPQMGRQSSHLAAPQMGRQSAHLTTSQISGLPAPLPVSKVLEIAFLEEDELAELGEGGTVAGLTLDEVDRMSVREVRAALRAEKEQRRNESALREQIIAKKEQKISQLERQLRGMPEPPPDEAAQHALLDIAKRVRIACVDIDAAARVVSAALTEASRLPGVDIARLNAFAASVRASAFDLTMKLIDDVVEQLDTLRPTVEAGPDVSFLG